MPDTTASGDRRHVVASLRVALRGIPEASPILISLGHKLRPARRVTWHGAAEAQGKSSAEYAIVLEMEDVS